MLSASSMILASSTSSDSSSSSTSPDMRKLSLREYYSSLSFSYLFRRQYRFISLALLSILSVKSLRAVVTAVDTATDIMLARLGRITAATSLAVLFELLLLSLPSILLDIFASSSSTFAFTNSSMSEPTVCAIIINCDTQRKLGLQHSTGSHAAHPSLYGARRRGSGHALVRTCRRPQGCSQIKQPYSCASSSSCKPFKSHKEGIDRVVGRFAMS
ncbi:hypothetical protein GWK47_050729 [Chionoecetes opilio]|uniref:Uncharacterized protein n=1 Tax=Chionoecetes opilio TaxID=41210 RepID=A0A8J5CDF2_CHIOP|nr:hypothetical protein GWK47_050729 [Chionoecetes opilio]